MTTDIRRVYSPTELKLLGNPHFVGWYSVHGRHFVRVRTPGQRLFSKVIEGDTPEKAAALALVTLRITS